MKKEALENIKNSLPSAIKNLIDYLKQNLEKTGQTTFENLGGTVGLLVQIFGKSTIDNYFQKIEQKKLANYGNEVYFKAGVSQANNSFFKFIEQIPSELSPKLILDLLNDELTKQMVSLEKEKLLMIFHPKYHPTIELIKRGYSNVIIQLTKNEILARKFIKDFNGNIKATLIEQFGPEIYHKHVEEIDELRLKENELSLLLDIYSQNKIGFDENENLKYIESNGSWELINNLKEFNNTVFTEDIDTKPCPVEYLISQYFANCNQNSLENILFIIADFGKGKSVFLRNYASTLAKNYLDTEEGYFPIYFNLRNFKQYSSDTTLGVISDFLETEYAFKVDLEDNKTKKYIFLIDSLDESGDLNKASIENVITSIKRIQNLDKITCRQNRIIITSRPFDEITSIISSHKPHQLQIKQKNYPCYLSLHGFTKSQFNEWINYSIKEHLAKTNSLPDSDYLIQFANSISKGKQFNLYTELSTSMLSESELQRPIFAYMIYQLIKNKIDFKSFGKIGVYLSFVNLLSKDAKYIHDPEYKTNLKDQLTFRNILHSISTLWMYQRHYGKHGILNKSDVIRIIEGKGFDETDSQLLEKHKTSKVNSVQFLSHSYFGENENSMHFQHQSFAEILFAEYIFKIFIKHSLDQSKDIDLAALKLEFGEPTEQTIGFFKELVQPLLARACSSCQNTLAHPDAYRGVACADNFERTPLLSQVCNL